MLDTLKMVYLKNHNAYVCDVGVDVVFPMLCAIFKMDAFNIICFVQCIGQCACIIDIGFDRLPMLSSERKESFNLFLFFALINKIY